MTRSFTFLTLLTLWLPVAVSGQSLFNAAGLGLPSDAIDARSRSLGGVGLGLRGPSIQSMDPCRPRSTNSASRSLAAQG